MKNILMHSAHYCQSKLVITQAYDHKISGRGLTNLCRNCDTEAPPSGRSHDVGVASEQHRENSGENRPRASGRTHSYRERERMANKRVQLMLSYSGTLKVDKISFLAHIYKFNILSLFYYNTNTLRRTIIRIYTKLHISKKTTTIK